MVVTQSEALKGGLNTSEHLIDDEVSGRVFGEKGTRHAVLGNQAVVQDNITAHVHEPSHCFYEEKTGRIDAIFFACALQDLLFEHGIHHKIL